MTCLHGPQSAQKITLVNRSRNGVVIDGGVVWSVSPLSCQNHRIRISDGKTISCTTRSTVLAYLAC